MTRCGWRIRGQVQGVGYRPFIYRLAHQHRLTGFVRNDSQGLTIEAQGSAEALDGFARRIEEDRPPLARVHSIERQTIPSRTDDSDFRIEISEAQGTAGAQVTVDAAVCLACLQEMFDASNRRHHYPLINCTHCGPRYSIARTVPYDRCNTTMATFEMCAPCGEEYRDPGDRRFHAQATACPACGPTVWLEPRDQRADPIRAAAELLEAGKAVAIKGLGGFHLAVRADDSAAVARLRTRKHRDHKPLAVMCRNMAAARQIVELSDEAAQLLQSPAAPIVLAIRRSPMPGGICIAPAVAPDNHRLGVMLPYTPIHHLLFDAMPSVGVLVMTSGNQSDEPLAIDNDDARTRLGPMADALLLHDRPIQRGVDDSVYLDMGDGPPLPIRRARGCVPAAIALPEVDEPTMGLCVGGELKNTVAVVRGQEAILSQHLGDLTHPAAFGHFQQAIRDLCDLFHVRPQWIAHDLHPVYLSTQHARQLASQWDVPLIGVQHHHAHAAAAMAEHGLSEPALAVVCDGTGYGTDGTTWGGELLLAQYGTFQRLAHLKPVRLPGGDQSAKDTRRCGLALLHLALGEGFANHPATRQLIADESERKMLVQMIGRDVGCAISCGMGRVFDAAASLLGLCHYNAFEAQAAMRLEREAWGQHSQPQTTIRGCPAGVRDAGHVEQLDLGPLIHGLLCDKSAALRAAEFHAGLAALWAEAVVRAASRTGIQTVVLSGGVFCNQILTLHLSSLLQGQGLRVLRHQVVPPNDGGIALGQAAVARAIVSERAAARPGRAG